MGSVVGNTFGEGAIRSAGNGALRLQIHTRFTALGYSCSIGGTHVTQLAGAKDLPGPRATVEARVNGGTYSAVSSGAAAAPGGLSSTRNSLAQSRMDGWVTYFSKWASMRRAAAPTCCST